MPSRYTEPNPTHKKTPCPTPADAPFPFPLHFHPHHVCVVIAASIANQKKKLAPLARGSPVYSNPTPRPNLNAAPSWYFCPISPRMPLHDDAPAGSAAAGPVAPAFGHARVFFVNDFLRLDCHVHYVRGWAGREAGICLASVPFSSRHVHWQVCHLRCAFAVPVTHLLDTICLRAFAPCESAEY